MAAGGRPGSGGSAVTTASGGDVADLPGGGRPEAPPAAPVLVGRLAQAVGELPRTHDMWRTYEPALPYDAPRRVTRDPDIQREIWRVRATAGRRGPAFEFELCLDLATREWTLTHDGALRRRMPRGG